jgi:predicted DNA binding CopG/RHH family protein
MEAAMARKKDATTPTAEREPRHHSFDARLTIRIDDDCLHALDRWARREGVTAATLARTILEDAIQREGGTSERTPD